MKSFMIVLAAALYMLLTPAIGHAQERATVNVSYATGSFANMFTYPAYTLDPSRRSGKKFNDAGLDVSAKVRIIKGISAGYRFQYDDLTNSRFVDESVLRNGGFHRNIEPELNSPKGTMKYHEFYGSIGLPKTGGHSLILGFAKTDFTQVWSWKEQGGVGQSILGASFNNLVVGAEGKHRIRKAATIDYAGRIHNRLSGSTGYGKQMPFEPSGFEFRGGGVYQVNRIMGVSAHYQYRTLNADEVTTGANGQPWPMVEHHTEKKVLLGLSFSF